MGLSNSTLIGNNDNSVTIKRSSQFASRPHDTSWKSQLQQQQQPNGKGRCCRRTLPLLARWTIALDDLRSMSAESRNPQLEDQIINIIRMSNGRPFPHPLWLLDFLQMGGSKERVKKIKECDIKFSTALAFYSCLWYNPIYRQIGLTLFRYTCPLFLKGGPDADYLIVH
jgi:hypothetical protein